ncbi:MAG: hypothetical protein IKK26_04745 [Clostridia bacterium]|nr:hypothetical protein [Clostridia bacterium]
MNNNESRVQQQRRMRTAIYLYVLLALLSLFSVATYTWFSLSRTPEVSEMALHVNSPTGLELSVEPDAKEWQLQLNFSEIIGEVAPLRPVTWSQRDNRFYAVSYSYDGRVNDVLEPLSDGRNANKDNADGYYMKGTFYARTAQKVHVSLTSAIEVAEGIQGSGTYVIGKPIWNSETVSHDNGGNGAELAIRIGILVEKTDLSGELKNEASEFYIYEPNYDKHVDKEDGYIATPSIDGTATVIPEENIILQSLNSWKEADPVRNGTVIHTFGEFDSDMELFALDTDELAKISLYVWLEGQDVDCINAIGHEAELMANIQFTATTDGQSGMVPIN